ncbi:hypothetical protein ABPG72_005948 [Tetrahymena utriculariae]
MIRELSKKNSSVTTEDQEESKEENDPNHLSQRGINEAISYDIEDSNIFNKNQTNQGQFSYQNSSQAQELEESKESSQSVQYTSQEIFRIQENNSNNNSQQSTNYGSSQGIYCYPNDSISGYVFSQENQIIKNESQENNPNNHAFYPANNLNFEQDPIQYEILNQIKMNLKLIVIQTINLFQWRKEPKRLNLAYLHLVKIPKIDCNHQALVQNQLEQ